MPRPMSLWRMIGPSFILLGLGLGSGELILWPYLSVNYGLGIIWGAVLGITLQFFINMEIERYTLVTGESVFVGLARKWSRLMPVWFIFSTFLPWVWPGIALSGATILSQIFGAGEPVLWAIGLMLLVGVILSFGRVIYKTQEKWQKALIVIGVPVILIIALVLASEDTWSELGRGVIGIGDGYWFLPAGLQLFTFLGALAYSGAGGNLNLAQSYYIREKGYGMGKYFGRITSLIRGLNEKVKLEGGQFEINQVNLSRFRRWWKLINIEHGLVFWLTGLITMLMLSLLARETLGGDGGGAAGIGFIISEGEVIGERLGGVVGWLFLLVAGMMLFSTQLSVMDATSRIMAENLVIADRKKFPVEGMPKYFYAFLWLQIVVGILILMFGFRQPLLLVTLGAVLNAWAMFVYTAMVLWLNRSRLSKEIRPGWLRVGMLVLALVVYGTLGGWAVMDGLGVW